MSTHSEQDTQRHSLRGAWCFCVAPMMGCTDRHARYLLRLLSRRARLYTEMLHAGAVVHGKRARLLDFDPAEHPLALQLGGSDPGLLAQAARIGAAWGYDEINLNVGCPSPRVQQGRFGARLMAEPALVAECVAAMRDAVQVPVTVKTRIGIDRQDSFGFLLDFAAPLAAAGCTALIVHARKAWLDGLSPRENRTLPPLDYDRVARLKRALPGMPVVLNGGIERLEEAARQLERFDGVMLGRAAYHRPLLLQAVDARLFGERHRDAIAAPGAVLARYADYAEREIARGERPRAVLRHLLGLGHGLRGGRRFRRLLTLELANTGDVRALVARAAAALGAGSAPRPASSAHGSRAARTTDPAGRHLTGCRGPGSLPLMSAPVAL